MILRPACHVTREAELWTFGVLVEGDLRTEISRNCHVLPECEFFGVVKTVNVDGWESEAIRYQVKFSS